MQGEVPRGEAIHISAPWSLGCARRHVWSGEVCIAGDSASGRGHTYQRPFVIRQCPLPLPANLSVLLTLPCPGALPLLFHPTPGRTCPISRPAYAPTTKSPARYRAGRAKQHNHARNVKPLPPRRSPGRTLPGQEGVKGGHLPVPLAFFASFWQKKEESPSLYAP